VVVVVVVVVVVLAGQAVQSRSSADWERPGLCSTAKSQEEGSTVGGE